MGVLEIETDRPVCRTHNVRLVDVGPGDWDARDGHNRLVGWCPVGNHVVPESLWAMEYLPLLTCLSCCGLRPAREVTSDGHRCVACGTYRDYTEPAKEGE